MFTTAINGTRMMRLLAAVTLLGSLLLAPAVGSASPDKKKAAATPQAKTAPAKPKFDPTKLVWPSPPNVPRIKWMGYFAGQKFDESAPSAKPKQKWMDRLAGVKPEEEKGKRVMPFQLLAPVGMGVDSKGTLFVADQRVGAVFMFNTETKDAELIHNGAPAPFKLVNGIAVDDDDRVFISDGKLHHVLVFNAKHEVVDQIAEGLVDPNGLAIDRENRILYVVDTQQDQVFAYDADSLKLLRKIGTGGKNHELTTPGDFSGPTGVAVDKDGSLYVADTMNYRVEVFDADGNFVRQFGRHCDGPGCFAHPKGVAVDGDGNIWVADAMLDLLQVFNKEGELLAFLGGHGNLPGQFFALANVFVDKQNRVFTSEQYPGRVQMFKYVTESEAAQLKKEKEDQRLKDRAARTQAAAGSQATDSQTGPKQAEAKQ
jgi:sugar lactone lactonase YvrE